MTRNTDPVPEERNPGLASSGVPVERVDTSTEQVVVRRSPRYLRLIALGAGVGAAGAFFASVLREPADGYSQAQVFGFLLIFGIVLGGALGIIVALLLDRVASRGQRTLMANKLVVQVPDGAEVQAAQLSPTAQASPTAQLSPTAQASPAAQPVPAVETASPGPEHDLPVL